MAARLQRRRQAAEAALGQYRHQGPKSSDILYVKALAAPFTVNTMPEATLKALAEHTDLGTILPADGGDCEQVPGQFAKAGIDIDALAIQLQDEGAKSFVQSWSELMGVIAARALRFTRPRGVRGARSGGLGLSFRKKSG